MAGGIPQNLLASMSVRLGMDTKAFSAGTKQAKSNLLGFNSSLGGVKALMGAVFGSVAIRMIKQFADAAIDAYKIQLEAETKLTTVMKQRFNATEEMVDSIKKLAREQQALGVIGDEVQLSGAQQLATFLHQEEALKVLIPAMNNLIAQQKGYNATAEDAVTIANMMGKVFVGQIGALSRAGISFDKYQERVMRGGTEMEKAAMLAEVLTDNVGNMNEELAKTDLGKLQQLKNLLDDIKEDIGKEILPIKVEIMKDFYDDVQIWTTSFASFWEKISTLFDSSGERTQRALDKIHARIEEAQKWADENKDLGKLTGLFMTDEEKRIAALKDVTIDKINVDKQENKITEQKIILYDELNKLIEEQEGLKKGATTEAQIADANKELEILREKKKLYDDIGTKAYVEKQTLTKLKQQPVPALMEGKGIQLQRTEEIPGLEQTLKGDELVSRWQFTADEMARINEEIKYSFTDLSIGFAESFGQMIGSAENFKPGNLLLPLANMAEGLGKLAIQMGIAKIGIDKALTTPFGGAVAIAAGIALVALANAVKSNLSSISSGGGYSGMPQFNAAENYDATGTRYYGQTARQEIHVTVDGEISGEVIRLANKRAELKHRLSS